jgi:hypothetical protein
LLCETLEDWKNTLFGVRLSATIGPKIIVEQTISTGLQQVNSISKAFMGREYARKSQKMLHIHKGNRLIAAVRALINTSFRFVWS